MNARVRLDAISQAIDRLELVCHELESQTQLEVAKLALDGLLGTSGQAAWPAPWFLVNSDSYGNDKG